MSDKDLVSTTVTQYMNLLRIEKAQDTQKEINNQKRELKIKLESMGITVEDLMID